MTEKLYILESNDNSEPIFKSVFYGERIDDTLSKSNTFTINGTYKNITQNFDIVDAPFSVQELNDKNTLLLLFVNRDDTIKNTYRVSGPGTITYNNGELVFNNTNATRMDENELVEYLTEGPREVVQMGPSMEGQVKQQVPSEVVKMSPLSMEEPDQEQGPNEAKITTITESTAASASINNIQEQAKPNLIPDSQIEKLEKKVASKPINPSDVKSKLIEIAKKLDTDGYNKLTNQQINEQDYKNENDFVIELFCFVVNRILADSVIFKLGSFSVDMFKEFLTLPDTVPGGTIFDGNSEEKGIDITKKRKIMTTIIDFLYIDLSNFKYAADEASSDLQKKQILGKMFRYYIGDSEVENAEFDKIKEVNSFIKSKNNYFSLCDISEENNGPLILYINDFIKSITTSYSYYDNVDWNGWKDIYYNLILERIQAHMKYIENILLSIEIFNYEKNKSNFKKALALKVQENADENVITFLKLRNNEEGNAVDINGYNRRFKIELNLPSSNNIFPNKLLLGYNPHNFPFYTMNQSKKIIIHPQMLKYMETYDKSAQFQRIGTSSTFNVNKYDNTYIFGEFSRLFTPDLSNKQIAGKMKIIQKKLMGDPVNNIPPKPVFMLGYGASGAGKTSSLIYFNKGNGDNRDGILIHLCNILGATENYPIIKIKCKEFYVTDDSEQENTPDTQFSKDDPNSYDLNKPKIVEIPNKELTCINSIDFEWNKTAYKLKTTYEHPNHHQYRTLTKRGLTKELLNKRLNEVKEDERDALRDKLMNDNTFQQTKIFDKGTSVGELVIHLIDTDRFVKATTNNPNSSRSHTLVFVEFSHKDKPEQNANIIIGDFAGVENTFACANPKVINDFVSISRDDDFKLPFYSTEKIGKNLDPYGPNTFIGEEQEEKMNEMKAKCNPVTGSHDGIAEPKTSTGSDDGIAEQNTYVGDAIVEPTPPEEKPITDALYDFNKPVFRASFDPALLSFYEVVPEKDPVTKNMIVDIKKVKPESMQSLSFYMNFIRGYAPPNLDNTARDAKITELIGRLNKFLNLFDFMTAETKSEYVKTNLLAITGEDIIINEALDRKIEQAKKDVDNAILINKNITIRNEKRSVVLDSLKTVYDGIKDGFAKTIQDLKDEFNYEIVIINEDYRKTHPSIAAKSKKEGDAHKDEWIKNKQAKKEETEELIKSTKVSQLATLKNTLFTKLKAGLNQTITIEGEDIGSLNKDIEKLNANSFDNIQVSDLDNNNVNLSLESSISDIGDNLREDKKDTSALAAEFARLETLKQNYGTFVKNFNANEEGTTQLVLDTSATKEGVTIKLDELISKMKTFFGIDKALLDSFKVPNSDNLIDKNKKTDFQEIYETIFKFDANDSEFKLFQDENRNIATQKRIKAMLESKIFEVLYKTITKMEKEYIDRTGNSKEICEHRRTEGYFINDSLRQVRSAIKEILYEKNKNAINIAPNFIDICFPSYCPSKEDCFNFESSSKTSNSVIIETIFKELYRKKLSNEKESIDILRKDFYKNVIVSVFCVFNTSRIANNPPPTPYIDINLLKLIYKTGSVTSLDTDGLNEFVTEAEKIVKMIKTDPYCNEDGNCENGDKLDEEKIPIEPYGFKNRVSGLLDIPTKLTENADSLDDDVDDATTIMSKFEKLLIVFKKYKDLPEDANKETYETIERKIAYENVIDEFIDMIDKNNAISAVGTLEFLDQLAKFNTVSNVCRSNTDYLDDTTITTYETNKENEIFELYTDVYKRKINEKKSKTYSIIQQKNLTKKGGRRPNDTRHTKKRYAQLTK